MYESNPIKCLQYIFTKKKNPIAVKNKLANGVLQMVLHHKLYIKNANSLRALN